MQAYYRQLHTLLAQRGRVAQGTTIRTAGSVPREVGAKMIIDPAGQHVGTVGGGCGEAEVIRAGLNVIHDGQPVIVVADLTADISLEGDGLCGGKMFVLVEPLPPACYEGNWNDLITQFIRCEEEGMTAAILTSLPPAPPRHFLLLEEGGKPGVIPEALRDPAMQMLKERRPGLTGTAEVGEWFVDILRAAPTLLIVGGGHIALPLAEMGRLLDFRVVVVDDRPSFANAQRFPWADRVICEWFDKALREFAIDRDTYIVIVTRGHQHDVSCLKVVLGSPAAYIGMIGSRRRVSGVFALMEKEEGISRELLLQVYSPIGLEIAARTPAEIAVSILAEITKVRRGGRVPSASDFRRPPPA